LAVVVAFRYGSIEFGLGLLVFMEYTIVLSLEYCYFGLAFNEFFAFVIKLLLFLAQILDLLFETSILVAQQLFLRF
jgi:hypothetical protein